MSVSVFEEPNVYLVGRQEVDDAALAAFLADEGVARWDTDTEVAGEKLVEVAGRTCYLSFARPRPGGNKAYLGHILEVGHGSVLEHAVFNFIITGVSRSFTHELVRHRAGFGYSMLSQRFVDESDVAFVVPPLYADAVRAYRYMIAVSDGKRGDETEEEFRARYQPLVDSDPEMRDMDLGRYYALTDVGEAWLAAVEAARKAYARLSDLTVRHLVAHIEDSTARRKAAREAARSVLPNATETKIFVTANARALRHFVEQRAAPGADAEIRRVAVAVLRLLQGEAPGLFGDYTLAPCATGGEYADTPHRKV